MKKEIMQNITIATACINSRVDDIEGNLKKIEMTSLEASKRGAHILCLPELSVTGYTLNPSPHIYRSLSQRGVEDRIEKISRRFNILLIVGLIDYSNSSPPFITQLISYPDGAKKYYRKTHLSPLEQEAYRAGDDIEIFEFKGWKLGIELCYEAHFPEISTILALKGVDLIFIPHASPKGTSRDKLRSWLRHLTARAFDNTVYICACNQVGENGEGLHFPGLSLILNPTGEILSKMETDVERILIAPLSLKELNELREKRMSHFLPSRRPELYSPLIQKEKRHTYNVPFL